ncbi:AslB Arylsulfatase regulator (Fe-S oxidoreductase) [uncultured Caudovirales phage]|uniref:AslB Arylsulfatase regulator (Fe-S oxidoreductase) n=1 Tax=uncultured Caudovirales phage TaxID=2100421 RepID=A0A6J5LH63_9CAUD|nr:AslB Arylsulfatase regulator (Fe-S oxidoreductase) [uncultured Caudovirales phage]
MKFEIHGQKPDGSKKIFYYDNQTNELVSEDGGQYQYSDKVNDNSYVATVFDKDHPLKKSKTIQLLKIQLGLGCNYSCDYCSQKFVERGEATSPKDIEAFMQKLEVLDIKEEVGLKVEFWGGEPLVYIKTLRPLAEAIRERFKDWEKKPQFSIITNGSILTDETIDWLMAMDFSISISHDGPGQAVRGPDPFDDPEQKKRLLGLYRMMTRLNKPISFNSMLSAKNMSRREISDWFVELTGDKNISLGEGGIVDAYDEDGITNSLQTKADHFKFRQTAFADIYNTDGEIAFKMQLNKINDFTSSVLSRKHASTLPQKCGMDNEHVLAVDLKGNVITCQNVSAAETSMNGESHLAGNLENYDNVEIKTSTHWSKRKDCADCPVLHLCKGACMFLDNKFWETSCANAYSDNVALFALSIEKMTGYIPVLIKSDNLPLERQDVFGTLFKHEEVAPKKVIPIKVVSTVAEVIDNVEIYGKAVVL